MLRSLTRQTRRWNMTAATKSKVVAIIGATGTGKSRLAVDLALKHNGEVINCDAMQMYEGLPIITNKISKEEQRGVPHHLLGTIKLDEPTWTVSEFVPEALRVIEGIRARGRLPILVGGTHYYIQSLLIKDTTIDAEAANGQDGNFDMLEQSTEVLLERLKEVDPVMAERWHPNERRKIQRSLQIWLQTGKRASDIYREQQLSHVRPDGSQAGPKQDCNEKSRLDPVVFWLHAAPEVLNARLDKRILEMMDNGLLSEIMIMDEFISEREAAGEKIDLSRGIWISIGYKEFAAFLEAQKHGRVDQLDQAKADGIRKSQIATRQYAKRQIRWVQYKFLNALHRNGIDGHTILLDGSDTSKWYDHVTGPAVDIVFRHLTGQNIPLSDLHSAAAHDLLVPKGQDVSHDREEWLKRTCETCQVVAVTRKEWNKHIESNRHKRATTAANKRSLTAPSGLAT